MKTKIEFLNNIELKVRDGAKEFTKSFNISAVGAFGSGVTPITLLTDDNNSKPARSFTAGNNIYVFDGTANSKYTTVASVVSDTVINVSGDVHLVVPGGIVKETPDIYLTEALLTYSKFKPLRRVKLYNAVSSGEILVPEDYNDELGNIISVEYPIGYIPKRYYGNFEVCLNDVNALVIQFETTLSGDARVNYETIHSFDNTLNSTVPDTDFGCVCDIAASYYLLAMAARYGQLTDPSLGTDYANKENKVNQFIKLSNEYLIKAGGWLGVDIDELKKGVAEDDPVSSNQSAYDYQSEDTIFNSQISNINFN